MIDKHDANGHHENSHSISDNSCYSFTPCEKVPLATVSPEGSLEILSAYEVKQLVELSHTDAYELFKNCALAVLNTGSTIDDTNENLFGNRAVSSCRLKMLQAAPLSTER